MTLTPTAINLCIHHALLQNCHEWTISNWFELLCTGSWSKTLSLFKWYPGTVFPISCWNDVTSRRRPGQSFYHSQWLPHFWLTFTKKTTSGRFFFLLNALVLIHAYYVWNTDGGTVDILVESVNTLTQTTSSLYLTSFFGRYVLLYKLAYFFGLRVDTGSNIILCTCHLSVTSPEGDLQLTRLTFKVR